MARRCVKFMSTARGRRCARYAKDGAKVQTEHALVDVPLFDGYGVTGKVVSSNDVLLGTVAGVVGGGAVKWLVKQVAPAQPFKPEQAWMQYVMDWMPLLGAGLAGTALFFAQNKENPSRAEGHLVGAVAAGAAMQGVLLLAKYVPAFAGMVTVPYAGYLVSDSQPQMAGYIVGDQPAAYADVAGLSDLAALAMSEDED